MNTAYLSIGSNTNPVKNLTEAVALLRAEFEIGAVSAVYETEPVGEKTADAPYLNAAVELQTALDPAALKERLLGIEQQFGREKGSKTVTIDLDIVLFNDEQYGPDVLGGARRIPDPAVYTQAYVAVPLADIAPELVPPGSAGNMEQIAAALTQNGGITRRDDVQFVP